MKNEISISNWWRPGLTRAPPVVLIGRVLVETVLLLGKDKGGGEGERGRACLEAAKERRMSR